MKKKYFCLLVLTLCACEHDIKPSNSISEQESKSLSCSETLSIPSSSLSDNSTLSSENSSTFSESSGLSISLSESFSPSVSEQPLIDVSEKEYYKSMVDRDSIVYTKPLQNDLSHLVRKLEVFQINDTHGAYDDDNTSYSSIAQVDHLIKSNINDPYATIKIANGDMLQGTAFSNMLLGEPAIAALNEMNFDCFVIGNHEFDWSIDNLKVYKDGNLLNGELNCPFLGANIVDENGALPDFVDPYTIVEKGDVKVGIIGIIGDGLESSISKVSIGNYRFASTVEVVKKYTQILKEEEKVDVIILVSHAHDSDKNQAYVSENEIDCIINAHDHRYVEESVTRYDGKRIPVIESNTKNGSVGKVTLTLNDSKEFTSYTMNHYYPDRYTPSENLKMIINEYFKVTNAYQNEVIGYSRNGFNRSDFAITTATYMADKYDCDLAIVNTGGVRNEIPAGEITNSMVYEAFPFDNELYISYISGKELKLMIPLNSISYYYYNEKGIGHSYEYAYSEIDDQKTYKIICIDYVATKEYMTKYFDEKHGLIKTGDYIRDCALENIKQNYKK